MKTSELDTPVLLIDADALEHNLQTLETMTRAADIDYRPHAKTHKSATIAHKQLDAGAVGICCAKLGEAEVMAANGIDNILITTPVIGQSKIGRLMQISNQTSISVVADSEENIQMLGSTAQLSGTKLDVLVEIDIGQGRCGVTPGPEAARLANIINRHASLNFVGLQGYQGKIQMLVDTDDRGKETKSALDKLTQTIAEFSKDGLTLDVLTGGGTGTSPFDLDLHLLTEIQAGSYVFMDARYGEIGWPGANAPPFEQALHILTGAVSKPAPNRLIVDAGLKAASSDHGPPIVADAEGQTYEFGGDEHGIIQMTGGGEVPGLIGDKLRLIPSHCDTTVNLYDEYMVVKGDTVIDVWPIDARGRVQ
ncbi:MAG: DSD1 family PLP-dependent enzyme [Pseudomonadota bacterium]|nr:DSD1 family PLP-dependent enzyme [Pseudomonadota bacterium]